MPRRQLALILLALGVPGGLHAQDHPRCFEFESLDGEWISYEGLGPSHEFDAETPFLQVPRRFIVSDSVTRGDRRTIEPLPGANSVFRTSSWTESTEGVILGWSTVDVGWVAKLSPDESTAMAEWRGTVERSGGSASDGHWSYRVLLRSIVCPTALAGDS